MITYHLDRWLRKDGTLGDLFRMDKLLCFTLEPKDAIPKGTYKLVWTHSPRLNKMTPRLVDVPGHEGILIHAGNTVADTEGCILVGNGWSQDKNQNITLQDSRSARNTVYELMEADLADHGYAEIEIDGEDV